MKTDDQVRWVKRFKEAHRALESLKKDVGEMPTIKIYLQKKDTELENAKLQMKAAHVNKINQVYQVEMENWHKILLSSMEIIQDNFLILRSLDEVDPSLADKLASLAKLLTGQRTVKFAEDGAEANPDVCLTVNNLLDTSDENPALSPQQLKKRSNDECELENDPKKSKNSSAIENFQFLQPKAMKSINFDAVASTSNSLTQDTDMNVTFEMNANTQAKILAEKSNKPSTSTASAVSRGKSD